MTSVEAIREDSSSCRALWLAVLGQVRDDIEDEPLNSMEFHEAKAFAIDHGIWSAARANIAACLEMDSDLIGSAGRKWVNARLKAEGLPPLPPPSLRGAAIKMPPLAPRRPVGAAPVILPHRNYRKFWPRRL